MIPKTLPANTITRVSAPGAPSGSAPSEPCYRLALLCLPRSLPFQLLDPPVSRVMLRMNITDI